MKNHLAYVGIMVGIHRIGVPTLFVFLINSEKIVVNAPPPSPPPHPPLKYGRVGFKNFGNKSVGEGQKILILEGRLCYGGGQLFQGDRQRILLGN